VETIVVDDADDRQTADTVRRLRTVHGLTTAQLRYETHEGSGASASRNHGVHVARGDTIALLDDDDYWAPDYLAGATSRLASSEANAVVTWRTGATGGAVRRYPNPTEGLAVQDVIVRNPGVVGSNICIRRDTYLELNGFDEDLPVSNDIDFFVRFLQGGCRYTVLHEPLVFVGGADGRRLTDPDRRRIAGLRAYARKHQEVLSRAQQLEMRRRIARAAFRQAQRDHTSRSIRRVLAGVGFVALTRPRDVGGIGRVAARLGGAARRSRGGLIADTARAPSVLASQDDR
jgi:glycosyltransferase involved in cell wall biosynthesis